MITACTIVARNYLAPARVLVDSFLAHHPDGRITVLLVDDEAKAFDASRERFGCLRLRDIGLDQEEVGRLAGLYEVTELATAVKPVLLRHLLRDSTDVIYLDPDIKIYGSLADASRLAREHGIVLTPHTVASTPRDKRGVDDFHILAAGVYNLGFIAVGPGSESFVDWWWQRTRREARIEPTRMMFTDQRWVDFVPSFFDPFILKDPTYNVAYWNLHERELTWTGAGYLVDGQPLTFFHFSGFDPGKPYLLSKHQGERPRILLSEHPALARICREYARSVLEAGATLAVQPYGWDRLPSGLQFDADMRRLYRQALQLCTEGEAPEPPNPFNAQAEARFMDWLNEPVEPPVFPTISRYLHSIYERREDLRKAFPDLAGVDGERYLEWVGRDGVVQHRIPPALVPKTQTGSDVGRNGHGPSGQLMPGVNVAGYFRAEVGVGEAARLLTRAIETAGIAHSTIAYDATPSRKAHPFIERDGGRAPYDVNIVCVNAEHTRRFAHEAGRRFFEGRYTAGYWFWELDRFPSSMHHAFDYVDEVWTATNFVASGIRAIGRRPVYTIPLPVLVPARSAEITRAALGVPQGFLFLFLFDFFSVLERKNPLGLIRAFDRAFRPGEGPVLILKTINGAVKLADLEQVRAAAAHREDILIIDEYYSAERKNSLMELCDCYVSLHRSEGFGLTMAEAMVLGKPVIATGYSGNMDFMTAENSYLVDYATGRVPPGCDPYPVGSPWAEPALDEAASLLRRVYEARDEAARKAARARQDILTKHDARTSAVVLRERLEGIRRRRARPVPAGTSIRGAPVISPSMSDSAPSTSLASLDRAASLLTPAAGGAPDRRFHRPLLFLQNLLLRVLRPYWWQQRQLQGFVIDALRQVAQDSARALEAEPHQRQALEAVWSGLHLLESHAKDDQERLRRLQARTADLEERPQAELAALQTSIAAFQKSTAAQLEALTRQLELTTAQARELSQRLYAIPYMHASERFSYVENGKPVLGFRGRRTDDGQAYAGFEDIFRGPESLIAGRMRVYVPLLKRHGRVLDIGCGRGEMLDLLRDAGVPAAGIDLDEDMVARCRGKGHAVERRDAISYLREQRDGSIPAIFTAQMVEHLPYEELMSFLHLSRAKLAPGGQLIFETVNPHAIEAFKSFWTDLTHQRPIFPEVAVAWCWLWGFDQAYVFFPHGSGELEKDRQRQGEYAVVATTGAGRGSAPGPG